MLVYKSGCILQILEGDDVLVRRMFGVIEADRRHRQVTLLFITPIEARSFPQWTMAFREYEVDDAVELEGFTELLSPGFDLEKLGSERGARMVKAFIKSIR